MKITIINNKIKIGSIYEFNSDGSDLSEEKLLELLSKIQSKVDIQVDEKLTGDDIKKCNLIKEILDAYINEYFDKLLPEENGFLKELEDYAHENYIPIIFKEVKAFFQYLLPVFL